MSFHKTIFLGRFFDDLDYTTDIITKNNGKFVDSWESADIIWKVSMRGFDNTIKNKEIYLFPHTDAITEKANLINTLSILFSQKEQENIAPKSIIITKHNLFESIYKLKSKYPANKIFIIKPSHLFGGMKVNVLFVNEIKKYIEKYPKINLWVVQEYIDSPKLIKHISEPFMCKFDLRVNFFMCTNRKTKRLEIYQYKEILVRVSDKEYSTNTMDQVVHVTNLDLREDILTENSTRNFTKTAELAQYYPAINKFIADYIIPMFKVVYYPSWNSNNNNYFQRFGIDLMINHNDKILLLEINSNPGQPNSRVPLNMAIAYTMHNKMKLDGVPEDFIMYDETQMCDLFYIDKDLHNIRKIVKENSKNIILNEKFIENQRCFYCDYMIVEQNSVFNKKIICKNKIIINGEHEETIDNDNPLMFFIHHTGSDASCILQKNKLLKYTVLGDTILQDKNYYEKCKKLIMNSALLKDKIKNCHKNLYYNTIMIYQINLDTKIEKIIDITEPNFANMEIGKKIIKKIIGNKNYA